MRTVHDLEAAFADLADTAPDAHTLTIPTAPARRPLRRTLAPAVAALATAAVIGSVLVVTLPDDRGPAPAAAAMEALQAPAADGPVDTTFRFTADGPAGTGTVRRYDIDRNGQRLEFRTPGNPAGVKECVTADAGTFVSPDCRRVAMVTLRNAGSPGAAAFDPAKIVERKPQDVDGSPGYFGRYARDDDKTPGLGTLDNGIHLYWEYAPGAWGDALAATRAEALKLARSVRPAQQPFVVPAVVEPTSDQHLEKITSEPSSPDGAYFLDSKAGDREQVFVSWDGGSRNGSFDEITEAQSETVNGHRWQLRRNHGAFEAVLQGTRVPVLVGGGAGTTRTSLRALVERVRLATDLDDQSTWFPASDLR